ncbi:MAG: hypothetical protein R3299_00300 [Arenibacter sp.]|nr:hypothetical protein [Arenibacter sp.]
MKTAQFHSEGEKGQGVFHPLGFGAGPRLSGNSADGTLILRMGENVGREKNRFGRLARLPQGHCK